MPAYTRRRFLADSTALALGSCLATRARSATATPSSGSADYRSNWADCPDRIWLGADTWSNPMQDWRIKAGRIECTHAAGDRNVHLLVREIAERQGSLAMRVRIGRVDSRSLAGPGSAGFRIGIQGPLPEPRNRLIFGRGIDAGLTGNGGLFIGEPGSAQAGTVDLARESTVLRLTAEPKGENCTLTLTASDPESRELGRVVQDVPAARLHGGVALVNNFGVAGRAGAPRKAKAASEPAGKFWFADWTITGTRLTAHADRSFGPILFSQYTISRGVLKLTAQMPPLGEADPPTVRLQVQRGAAWTTIGEEKIHPLARTATFRIERWQDNRTVPYRVAYALKTRSGAVQENYWTGLIRRDPVEEPVVSVADISCNIHEAFPNELYVSRMARLNPDILAFTGDQFYESSGGYGVVREPLAIAAVDYLRKWYLHGWTWRELMRDRPTISLPDDHDVYQGNLWGEAGAGRTTTQAAGGYDMAAEWVNMVYRTQTSHHPDPYDPTPAVRGTHQYYGPFVYGRISFAVLADRQYKSGPEGKVPNPGPRADHFTAPNFEPQSVDLPGLVLLGEKQEQFLREWVRDWRGADMKAVISQTVFTALPTTHGRDGMLLRADFDTNAWPQTPRNRALREMRKAFAFHIAGDQHIPAVVQYGIDEHRDAPVAFAGPAVNVGYPRWWDPAKAPWTKPRQAGLLGDFTDSFGHPLSVLAVRNGSSQPRTGEVLRFLDEKASGIGVVRFDKRARKITIDCWPLLPDPAAPDRQFPGWPLTIEMTANYGRRPSGHLPTLQVAGVSNPLFEVFEEKTGELVYALRPGPKFQPHVFAPGRYTVKVSDPDGNRTTEVPGLEAAAENRAVRQVRF